MLSMPAIFHLSPATSNLFDNLGVFFFDISELLLCIFFLF